MTPTLNHLGHSPADSAAAATYFRGHQWVHAILRWNVAATSDVAVYVDGIRLPNSVGIWSGGYNPLPMSYSWDTHENGAPNSLRMGAVSKFVTNFFGSNYAEYPRNFPSESTIDELYVWNNMAAVNSAVSLWQAGRYYQPRGAGEAKFTSQELMAIMGTPRRLAPASATVVPPTGPSPSTAPIPLQVPKLRLLGATWTWMGERVDASQTELLKDYRPGPDLHPRVEFSVKVDGVNQPVLLDPRGSLLKNALGAPMVVNTGLNYMVQIKIPDLQLDSILLTTPYIDDVTLFFIDTGLPAYFSYCVE